MKVPAFEDVLIAAERIKGMAVSTPLVRSSLLDDQTGGNIFLKAECLQRTGSFKFRGAYNALSALSPEEADCGIVAVSSGNHAQGVAEAARIKGYDATILMPSDAPKSKKDRTRRSGAQVIEYDRNTQDREKLGRELTEATGRRMVHPYNDFNVIAGQGTCGLEMCEDLAAMGLEPDHVLVCAGGGGLLAGIFLAVQDKFPNARVHPVEPEGYDDQRRSHAAGQIMGGNKKEPSVCDAIVSPQPGEMSFSLCRGKLGEGLVVSDDEALRAVAFAFHELKLVIEPGGAVCLAALLSGKLDVRGKTVVATLSGGNIDPQMMERALALGQSPG